MQSEVRPFVSNVSINLNLQLRQHKNIIDRLQSSLEVAVLHVNVRMIDQGSSELNIIIGVENRDFETALQAIYDIFVLTQL